jgi:hypothetical protein
VNTDFTDVNRPAAAGANEINAVARARISYRHFLPVAGSETRPSAQRSLLPEGGKG